MKSVVTTTAVFIIVVVLCVPVLSLDYGWWGAVVSMGIIAAAVLGVGIWSAILEARRRRRS